MSEPGQSVTNATPPSPGPSRSPALQVVVVLGLLAALVWALKPAKFKMTPAPLVSAPSGPDCPRRLPQFTPSNYTETATPLTGLSDAQKNRARFRMNMEPCACGCNQSVVSCRASFPKCKTSERLMDKIGAEERGEADSSPKP